MVAALIAPPRFASLYLRGKNVLLSMGSHLFVTQSYLGSPLEKLSWIDNQRCHYLNFLNFSIVH